MTHMSLLLFAESLMSAFLSTILPVSLMASKEPDTNGASSASKGSLVNGLEPSNKRSAPDSVKSFQEFLSFVLSLTIFGALTFAVVVFEIANSNDLSPSPLFSRETVITFFWYCMAALCLCAYHCGRIYEHTILSARNF